MQLEQELKGGIWKQELIQRPWRSSAYLTVSHDLPLCFLIPTRTIYSRVVLASVGWTLPQPSLIKEIFDKFA